MSLRMIIQPDKHDLASASALAPILGGADDLDVVLLGNLRLVYADFLVAGNDLR